MTDILDPKFNVVTIKATPHPQWVCWMAMHQDHCAEFIGDSPEWEKQLQVDEQTAGERFVRNCLDVGKGNHAHYGPLEHPQITLACGHFPHSVMVQARTHRIATFDVMSQRAVTEHIRAVVDGTKNIEDVFFFRPAGRRYSDRDGRRYTKTEADLETQKALRYRACEHFIQKLDQGVPPEELRDDLPQGIRQHFVFSFNARALLHICDLRLKSDAQLEIQIFSQMVFQRFQEWMPEVAEFYRERRFGKAPTAP